MDDRLHGQRAPSLRRRLLRLVTIATLLAWGLAAAIINLQARHDVQELMDGQLAETARILLARVPNEPAPLTTLPAERARLRGAVSEHEDEDVSLEFQVVRSDGTVFLRSANAPGLPPGAGTGYANIEQGGEPWRRLVLERGDGAFRVLIAHPTVYRDREALEIASNAILPLVLLLPFLVLLIYFSIRRGLRPLDNLASEVAMRSPENLSTLRTDSAPLEAKPLVKALNHLLGRLTTTIENERRFTADAAHELRTPLAALKVQAQIAMTTKDPAQHRHALAQVLVGTDRATRLVEQLLRLARLDPIVRLPDPRQVDLAGLVKTALADGLGVSAEARKTLRLAVPETPIPVSGDGDLLAIALRNLVDNALRYTPDGAAITVSAGFEHGVPLLAVEDNGPGVPAEELHRIVERFYRSSEAGGEGSGLGLAIVRRIAELHGARLEVENLPDGGFSARLRWCGLPTPPAAGGPSANQAPGWLAAVNPGGGSASE